MKKSVVRCAHAFLAFSLLSVVGCTGQDTDGFTNKAVSIDLVNPPCAEPGAVSGYIEGNGFGAENVTITVGGIEAEVLAATGADASFVVPEGIPQGPIEVVVTNPGGRIATINWVSCIIDLEVARIELTPGAVVLTEQGETYQLRAQAYNAAEQAIDADFTWTSADPADVEVGSMGLVEAMVPIGSAQITAEAQGVTSSLAVVTVARPVAGAVFVSDDQVVEDPSFDGEPADFGVGSLIQLTLEGIGAPKVGEILLPKETLSVGGRVANVLETSPGVYLVSLELVPLDEMYEEYAIDETFELSAADAIPGALVEDFYEAELQPDGSYLFTLRPEATVQKAGPVGTRKMYECSTLDFGDPDSVVGFPLQVDALPTSIKIEQKISIIFQWDSDAATEDRIAVKAELSGELSSKLTITAALEAKFQCKAELLRIPIPAFAVGPFYGGGIVPLGLGFSFGGKLTVADVGVEFAVKPKATAEMGILCPVGQGCDVYADGDVEVKPEVNWIFPDLNNFELRMEPFVSGFAYADLEIGVDLLLTRYAAKTLELKAGPVQAANLARVEGQIFDPPNGPDYKSDYKLSFDVTAGIGVDAKALLGFLGITLPKLEVKLSGVLFNSPTLAAASVDVGSYMPQDTVTFDVKLNPEDVNYLPFVYNIDEILIYEALELEDGTKIAREIASAAPSFDGQTDFEILWTPITEGTIRDNFFAAVETSLLPKLPDPLTFGILELGQVAHLSPCAQLREEFIDQRCGVDPTCPFSQTLLTSITYNSPLGTISEIERKSMQGDITTTSSSSLSQELRGNPTNQELASFQATVTVGNGRVSVTVQGGCTPDSFFCGSPSFSAGGLFSDVVWVIPDDPALDGQPIRVLSRASVTTQNLSQGPVGNSNMITMIAAFGVGDAGFGGARASLCSLDAEPTCGLGEATVESRTREAFVTFPSGVQETPSTNATPAFMDPMTVVFQMRLQGGGNSPWSVSGEGEFVWGGGLEVFDDNGNPVAFELCSLSGIDWSQGAPTPPPTP
jgi:hypothetical protein